GLPSVDSARSIFEPLSAKSFPPSRPRCAWISRDIGAETRLESETQMPKVVIYTTSSCPYCIAAKRLLTQKGVSFEEISIDGDPAGRAKMSERAGGRRTVPQIFIGESHVGGCDDLYGLEEAGRLDALLAEAH